MISWKATIEENRLVDEICKRFFATHKDENFSFLDLNMDIVACHLNGCPLKLQELLVAEDSDFTHDICGIHRHINRDTGGLEDFFLPRYSK